MTLAVRADTARRVAAGVLQAMTVRESRNDVPGWSVTGQASSRTAGGLTAGTLTISYLETGP